MVLTEIVNEYICPLCTYYKIQIFDKTKLLSESSATDKNIARRMALIKLNNRCHNITPLVLK